MKKVAIFLCISLFISIFSCASPRGNRALQGELEGFVAGTRGMLEDRAKAKEAQQQRDVIIRDTMRPLGPADRVMPYEKYFVYFWSRHSMAVVMYHLGTPDEVTTDQGFTLYRWGSYVFVEREGFDGVMCLEPMR